MTDTETEIEIARGCLDDLQMSLHTIVRGKHFHNDLRLSGIVRDLRHIAERLEPHIEALREGGG